MLPLEYQNWYRNEDNTFDKTRFQNGEENPAYQGKNIDPADKAFPIIWPEGKESAESQVRWLFLKYEISFSKRLIYNFGLAV